MTTYRLIGGSLDGETLDSEYPPFSATKPVIENGVAIGLEIWKRATLPDGEVVLQFVDLARKKEPPHA